MPLPLTGSTLAAYNNLPAIPPQEPLGNLLNSIVSGGALGAACLTDTTLDVVGFPLAVTLSQTGLYFVQLVSSVAVTGGSPSDGSLINNTNSGGLVLANTEYFVTVYRTLSPPAAAPVFFGKVPVTAPAFVFDEGIPLTMTKIEGFINVTTPGILSFSPAVSGSPTSVVLQGGSGLMVTKI